MSKRYGLFAIILMCLMLVSACGSAAAPAKEEAGVSGSQDKFADVWRTYNWIEVPSETVSHGDDYVIQWQDPGMEEHIRFLLDRPEGDILHSDVWDIQVLKINIDGGQPHDMIMSAPAKGKTAFSYEDIHWLSNPAIKNYAGKKFTDIVSLADLQHFDSLQAFNYYKEGVGSISDIEGIRNCENMKILCLDGAAPKDLSALESLQKLVKLTLFRCGELDLSPLAGLGNLRVLQLSEVSLVSLDPIADMPSLDTLMLNTCSFPDMDALKNSEIKCLDMGLEGNSLELYHNLDYSVLENMQELEMVDLTNHEKFTAEACNKLIAACPNLKCLNVSYDEAARDKDSVNKDGLEIFVATWR